MFELFLESGLIRPYFNALWFIPLSLYIYIYIYIYTYIQVGVCVRVCARVHTNN
jgi:hypothetical protein